MRRTLLLLAAVAALACGPAVPGSGQPAAARFSPMPLADPGRDRLYLASPGDPPLLSVVDANSGAVERTLPRGAAAPDWRRLYSVLKAGGETHLRAVRTADGGLEAAAPVPAWVQGVQLSANGRWLALTPSLNADARLTRFQLRDSSLQAKPVDVELPGAFSFDGLSSDGQRLYLLEWRGNGRYQVRLYEVGQGLLPFVIADKSEIGQLMSGTPAASRTSGDGQMQLTLYERNAKHQAFVHALPIGSRQQFAFCIDLPAPDLGWALTAAPDGRRFYAVNQLSGGLVELTETGAADPPKVRKSQVRTQPAAGLLGRAEAKEPPGAAVAALDPQSSALYLAGERGVVRVTIRDLRPAGQAALPSGDRVRSLAFGPSGWLYAIGENGRLFRIDPNRMTVAWSSGPQFENLEIVDIA